MASVQPIDRPHRSPYSSASDLTYHAMGLPFAQSATTSSTGLALVRSDSRIIWANPAFSRLIHLPGSPVGAPLDQALHQQFRLADDEATLALTQPEGSTLELQCGRQSCPVLLHVAALDGDTRIVVAASSASATVNGDAGTFSLGTTDPLTRLGNRQQLLTHIANLQDKVEYAMLCLDIDGFSTINESLGRADSDRLLQLVVDRLTRALRVGDKIFRSNGDEFRIVHPTDNAEQSSVAMAERLLAIFDRPFRLDEHLVQVGASIGIAITTESSPVPPVELMWQTESALRDAKRAGGQCSCVFNAKD